MNKLIVLFFGLILSTNFINAQSLPERVAVKACEYLESMQSLRQLEDSLNGSISTAMAQVIKQGTEEDGQVVNTVEGIVGAMRQVKELLPSYCYNVRRLLLEEKKKNFYLGSENPEANSHYARGNKFMEVGDYKSSIKEFKKATRLDKTFVLAIDHLAISYRRQEKFKKAIKIYKNSLAVFPEGDLALLNIAVAYSLINDYDNSLKRYKELKFLYPDNPEGYFGVAKILLNKEDYPAALDNLFIAHRMYAENNSAYIKDSEQLINLVYAKLQEKNQMQLFEDKAIEHNMSVMK